jgi:hypothetical protein
MNGRSALLIVGLAIAGALVTSAPATAKPLEKGRFHDVFTEFFTCESTGTPVQHDADVWVNVNFNQRGSSPFPYDRESAHGTDVLYIFSLGPWVVWDCGVCLACCG